MLCMYTYGQWWDVQQHEKGVSPFARPKYLHLFPAKMFKGITDNRVIFLTLLI